MKAPLEVLRSFTFKRIALQDHESKRRSCLNPFSCRLLSSSSLSFDHPLINASVEFISC